MAKKSDHRILTTITKRSKAHWGYSEKQMRLWDDELTVTLEYLTNQCCFKCVNDSNIIGYYAYEINNTETANLDSLFVLPEFIGQGIGSLLLTHAIKRLVDENCRYLTLDADPNAQSFYAQHNFEVIGQKVTSIEGRYMPIMQRLLI